MKKLVLLAIAASLAAVAQAQETRTPRWQAQVGLGLPTTQSGKNFVGSTAAGGGVSYTLGTVGKGTWGLYADSLMRSKDSGATTTSQLVSGMGVQYRVRSESNPALYYGVGLGGYTLARSSEVKTGNTTVTTTTTQETGGGRLFIGQDFGKRYFAELGYTAVGSVTLGTTKITASNISLGVGLRF